MEAKNICVKNLIDSNIIDLEVFPNETIRDIKKKIENIIGRKLVNKLMIKHKQKRNQTSLNDESQTVKDARIKNGDVITIGKSDVYGGKILIL